MNPFRQSPTRPEARLTSDRTSTWLEGVAPSYPVPSNGGIDDASLDPVSCPIQLCITLSSLQGYTVFHLGGKGFSRTNCCSIHSNICYSLYVGRSICDANRPEKEALHDICPMDHSQSGYGQLMPWGH